MNKETNPPQMTWKSILRQRMYDFLNVHAGNPEGATERGEEILKFAEKEIEEFLFNGGTLIKDFHCTEHGFIKPYVYCQKCVPTVGVTNPPLN